MKPEQERLRLLLTDTVTMLCKGGLKFQNELKIEGVIGITLDNSEAFIVHVNEAFAATGLTKCSPIVLDTDASGSSELTEVHSHSLVTHPAGKAHFLEEPSDSDAIICVDKTVATTEEDFSLSDINITMDDFTVKVEPLTPANHQGDDESAGESGTNSSVEPPTKRSRTEGQSHLDSPPDSKDNLILPGFSNLTKPPPTNTMMLSELPGFSGAPHIHESTDMVCSLCILDLELANW